MNVQRTNAYKHTYIHTYMHTDTACVQHVNVGLAQVRPNYCGLMGNLQSLPNTCSNYYRRM